MSGALPITPGFSSIDVIPSNMVITEYSESGKVESRNTGGTGLSFKITYGVMNRSMFMPVWAFLLKQKGSFESFTFIDPSTATPQGIATGTPLVVGAHTAGDETIATDGWTASQTGILLAGDVLKFGGHNQVYHLTDDADSDGAGASTLSIYPPLEEALANNESITVNDVPYTVKLVGDISERKTSAPSLIRYSFECREAK